MKKIFSILIIIILIISMGGCEANKKADTVYVEWFGATIDLSNIDRIFPIRGDGMRRTLDKTIEYYENYEKNFAVLRVKCTGNWVQKLYEKEHREKHTDIEIFMNPNMYMEIPFEVIDILEGNGDLVQKGNEYKIEIPNLHVDLKNKDEPYAEWKEEAQFELYYEGTNLRFEYPRVGYEYIVIVEQPKGTDCFVTNEIICELSTPKEQYEIAIKLHYYHEPGKNTKVNYDDYVAKLYYEALERYNIKVR